MRAHCRQPHAAILDQVGHQPHARDLVPKFIGIKLRRHDPGARQIRYQHLPVRLRLDQHRVGRPVLCGLDRRCVIVIAVIARHALHLPPQDRPFDPPAPCRQQDQVRDAFVIVEDPPRRGCTVRRRFVRRQRRVPRLQDVFHLRGVFRFPPLKPRTIHDPAAVYDWVLLVQGRPNTARRTRLPLNFFQFLCRELFRPQCFTGLTAQNIVIDCQCGQDNALPFLPLSIALRLIQPPHVVAQVPARPDQYDRRVFVLPARVKIRAIPCPQLLPRAVALRCLDTRQQIVSDQYVPTPPSHVRTNGCRVIPATLYRHPLASGCFVRADPAFGEHSPVFVRFDRIPDLQTKTVRQFLLVRGKNRGLLRELRQQIRRKIVRCRERFPMSRRHTDHQPRDLPLQHLIQLIAHNLQVRRRLHPRNVLDIRRKRRQRLLARNQLPDSLLIRRHCALRLAANSNRLGISITSTGFATFAGSASSPGRGPCATSARNSCSDSPFAPTV